MVQGVLFSYDLEQGEVLLFLLGCLARFGFEIVHIGVDLSEAGGNCGGFIS